jgi:hypothetical protein
MYSYIYRCVTICCLYIIIKYLIFILNEFTLLHETLFKIIFIILYIEYCNFTLRPISLLAIHYLQDIYNSIFLIIRSILFINNIKI